MITRLHQPSSTVHTLRNNFATAAARDMAASFAMTTVLLVDAVDTKNNSACKEPSAAARCGACLADSATSAPALIPLHLLTCARDINPKISALHGLRYTVTNPHEQHQESQLMNLPRWCDQCDTLDHAAACKTTLYLSNSIWKQSPIHLHGKRLSHSP